MTADINNIKEMAGKIEAVDGKSDEMRERIEKIIGSIDEVETQIAEGADSEDD